MERFEAIARDYVEGGLTIPALKKKYRAGYEKIDEALDTLNVERRARGRPRLPDTSEEQAIQRLEWRILKESQRKSHAQRRA